MIIVLVCIIIYSCILLNGTLTNLQRLVTDPLTSSGATNGIDNFI